MRGFVPSLQRRKQKFQTKKHLLMVSRCFFIAGGGVLDAPRADAGIRPCKSFLFCRGLGLGFCRLFFLGGRGFLRRGGVEDGLIVSDSLIQLVDFGLNSVAGSQQVGILTVGIAGSLSLLQFVQRVGQISLGLIHGSLCVDDPLCRAQFFLGGCGGLIGDTAFQQNGLFRQSLLAAVGGGQGQALTVVAAPDSDKALAGGHSQRRHPSE